MRTYFGKFKGSSKTPELQGNPVSDDNASKSHSRNPSASSPVSTATDAPQPAQRQDENLAGNFEQLNMRDSEIASSQASKNPGDTGTSSRRYQEAQLPTNKGNTKLGKAIKSHSLNPFTTPPQRPQSTPYSFSSGNPQLGIASNAPKPILIAVFGMTGTGKTTLIKNLAGNAAVELRTGHGLESCTQDIEKVDCIVGGQNVTLVDTPGFDDSKRSDTEILSLIAQWLQTSYRKDALLSGMIYLHRISDVRMSGSSVKNLRMFRKLCGSDNMSKVCLATTMWDKVTTEEGELREKGLYGPDGFWNMMISNGSKVKRHDGSLESARNLILDMLDNTPTTIKLQDEIASGKALIDTDAGASINEELLKLQKEHKEDLDAVKEEMAIAMKQGNKRLQKQLQAEHSTVVTKMKKQAEEQYQLQQIRSDQLERELKDASDARKRLEKGLEDQKETSRRQQKQAAKLIDELEDIDIKREELEESLEEQREASRRQEKRARKLEKEVQNLAKEKEESLKEQREELEENLEEQREASRRQEKRARKLEKEVKNLAKEKERLKTRAEQQQNHQQSYRGSGGKVVRCKEASCRKQFIIYGFGGVNCPSCDMHYNTTESFWNLLPFGSH